MASKIDPPACSFCSIHSNQKHDIWWLLDTIFVYATDTKQVATDKRWVVFSLENRRPRTICVACVCVKQRYWIYGHVDAIDFERKRNRFDCFVINYGKHVKMSELGFINQATVWSISHTFDTHSKYEGSIQAVNQLKVLINPKYSQLFSTIFYILTLFHNFPSFAHFILCN